MDSWVSAGDGLSRCTLHPGTPAFAAHVGCADCHADDSPAGPEADVPGEGELLCREAARRNLPDAFEVESRMWTTWAFATKRSESCARIADEIGGDDFDKSAKYEAAAAKWADVAVKAGKLATAPVLHRERMAELERRARMVKSAKGVH